MTQKKSKGSVREFKKGVYQGRVLLGYDSKTGREIRPVVYGKSTQEVWKKLIQIIERNEHGQPLRDSKMKFGDWLASWLDNHVKIRSRLTTWENYKWVADTHIIPIVGKVPIKNLRPHHLQELYRQKFESGRIDKTGGLSARTVQLIHRICHAALEQAVREDLIVRNVAHLASLPKRQRKEMKAMTEEQVRTFLQGNKDDPMFSAFFLLVSTGMRRGEILGLRWTDVDLDKQTVYVQRSWVKSQTKSAQFAEPKTAMSRRVIPLTAEAVAVLQQHKEKQVIIKKEKEEKSKKYEDQSLIFCAEDGNPLYPGTLNTYLANALKRADLPKFRMHDIRHTFASLMIARGVPIKVVQELMGHTTVQMTLDNYTHVMPGMKEGAMEQLKSVFTVMEPTDEAITVAQINSPDGPESIPTE